MRVVVSSEGTGLTAATSPIFGRCPVYVFVDTDTLDVESIPNPAQNAAGGAGIRAAQFVISKEIQAVLSGNIGPNANNVLEAAGIDIYLIGDTTVEGAVKDFTEGRLSKTSGASTSSHTGMGAGQPSGSESRRDNELAALSAQMTELRARLADIMTRIEILQKEE